MKDRLAQYPALAANLTGAGALTVILAFLFPAVPAPVVAAFVFVVALVATWISQRFTTPVANPTLPVGTAVNVTNAAGAQVDVHRLAWPPDSSASSSSITKVTIKKAGSTGGKS